jgi:hypothetical protein
MPRRLPKGCVEDRDRHGNIRIYYRSPGMPKVRLRGAPWTPEFMQKYEAAVLGDVLTEESPRAHIRPDTWGWLCVRYFAECADFQQLDARTQRVRRLILEATFDEPLKPGSELLMRDCPLRSWKRKHVEVLRDRKIKVPAAANSRLKAMRQVFRWAVKQEGTSKNCCQDRSRAAPE